MHLSKFVNLHKNYVLLAIYFARIPTLNVVVLLLCKPELVSVCVYILKDTYSYKTE